MCGKVLDVRGLRMAKFLESKVTLTMKLVFYIYASRYERDIPLVTDT